MDDPIDPALTGVQLAVGPPAPPTSAVRLSFRLVNGGTVSLRVLDVDLRGAGVTPLAARVGFAHDVSPTRVAPGGRPLSPPRRPCWRRARANSSRSTSASATARSSVIRSRA